MKNFYTGLTTFFNALTGGVHNDFYIDIGGRLYNERAPENATYLYAVHSLISAVPDRTFTERYDDLLIQFDIFSSNSSPVEIVDAMTHLNALFNECTFAITSDSLVWMRQNAFNGPFSEDAITSEGTQQIWHSIVDYEVTLQK